MQEGGRGLLVLQKEIYEDEIMMRLSFIDEGTKIVVLPPCGDAFVYNGLYQEMSHKALRHQGPF